MVLLAAGSEQDAIAINALGPLVRSMASITVSEMGRALAETALEVDHPLYHLMQDEALEDAALGGAQGAERLFSRRQARRVSRSELSEARKRAGEIGYLGESLVQAHLEQQVDAGRLKGFIWVADQNAVAPYDFHLTLIGGAEERMDVKATEGEFERMLHVSMAELRAMADTVTPYRLYRMYDMDERRGTLRISVPLSAFARKLLDLLTTLPNGVQADGLSIDPTKLPFGPPVLVRLSFDSPD